MTFTYDDANLGLVIKKFSYNGCNFYVEYLDGSSSEYYCSNENEYSRLMNLMLEQALERQEKMNSSHLEINKKLGNVIRLLLSYLTVLSLDRQKDLLALVAFVFLIISTVDVREKKKKIQELKKYQMFLDIVGKLDEVNETELLKCVEFEPMYQIPLNINTLDEYSYGEMKRIRKNFDELKKGE